MIHSNDELYAYDLLGNRVLISIVNPVRKIVCDSLEVAYIDIVDDLYVMGQFFSNTAVEALPREYTLTPVFIEHDVFDVDMFDKFCILKKGKTNIFD